MTTTAMRIWSGAARSSRLHRPPPPRLRPLLPLLLPFPTRPWPPSCQMRRSSSRDRQTESTKWSSVLIQFCPRTRRIFRRVQWGKEFQIGILICLLCVFWSEWLRTCLCHCYSEKGFPECENPGNLYKSTCTWVPICESLRFWNYLLYLLSCQVKAPISLQLSWINNNFILML